MIRSLLRYEPERTRQAFRVRLMLVPIDRRTVTTLCQHSVDGMHRLTLSVGTCAYRSMLAAMFSAAGI